MPDDSGSHETGHGACVQSGREVLGELFVCREPVVVLADQYGNVWTGTVADAVH